MSKWLCRIVATGVIIINYRLVEVLGSFGIEFGWSGLAQFRMTCLELLVPVFSNLLTTYFGCMLVVSTRRVGQAHLHPMSTPI